MSLAREPSPQTKSPGARDVQTEGKDSSETSLQPLHLRNTAIYQCHCLNFQSLNFIAAIRAFQPMIGVLWWPMGIKQRELPIKGTRNDKLLSWSSFVRAKALPLQPQTLQAKVMVVNDQSCPRPIQDQPHDPSYEKHFTSSLAKDWGQPS